MTDVFYTYNLISIYEHYLLPSVNSCMPKLNSNKSDVALYKREIYGNPIAKEDSKVSSDSPKLRYLVSEITSSNIWEVMKKRNWLFD